MQDASYYAWVRAPGELYRGGYGSSLVIVDANTGGVRGTWPATEADPARAVIASFYPLHTGESLGTLGRILTMSVGLLAHRHDHPRHMAVVSAAITGQRGVGL